ncbi:hydrogenase maturation protease [uncultured Lutibacter sp.]|uniref:hydrogenase maturation protease n=1 Tax=uncultured Lutibacter sp. TaxID=437739 RepID=UPI00262F7ADA|nr:hydrogenase maturation protease [uncultured Lutibacter sp.]
MKKLDNTLIIGIGNNTRQDDGLGWCFLEHLEKEGYHEDSLLYKYQLMVEDAELIAKYEKVIFVDACKTQLNNGFEIERVLPAEKVAFSTHEVPPNQILNLCETIYQKKPKSYIIKIQGYVWDIQIGLSNEATENLKKTVSYFKHFAL